MLPVLVRPIGVRGPFSVTESEIALILAEVNLSELTWHEFTYGWPIGGRDDYLTELAGLAPTV